MHYIHTASKISLWIRFTTIIDHEFTRLTLNGCRLVESFILMVITAAEHEYLKPSSKIYTVHLYVYY